MSYLTRLHHVLQGRRIDVRDVIALEQATDSSSHAASMSYGGEYNDLDLASILDDILDAALFTDTPADGRDAAEEEGNDTSDAIPVDAEHTPTANDGETSDEPAATSSTPTSHLGASSRPAAPVVEAITPRFQLLHADPSELQQMTMQWSILNTTHLNTTSYALPGSSPALSACYFNPESLNPYKELRQRFGAVGNLLPPPYAPPKPKDSQMHHGDTRGNQRDQLRMQHHANLYKSTLAPGAHAKFPSACTVDFAAHETRFANGFYTLHDAIPMSFADRPFVMKQNGGIVVCARSHATMPSILLPLRYYTPTTSAADPAHTAATAAAAVQAAMEVVASPNRKTKKSRRHTDGTTATTTATTPATATTGTSGAGSTTHRKADHLACDEILHMSFIASPSKQSSSSSLGSSPTPFPIPTLITTTTTTQGTPSTFLGGENHLHYYYLSTYTQLIEQLHTFLQLQGMHDYNRMIAFCQVHLRLPQCILHLSYVFEYHNQNADAFETLRLGVALFERTIGKEALSVALTGKLRLLLRPSSSYRMRHTTRLLDIQDRYDGDVQMESEIKRAHHEFVFTTDCNRLVTICFFKLLTRYAHFLSKKACSGSAFGIALFTMLLTDSIDLQQYRDTPRRMHSDDDSDDSDDDKNNNVGALSLHTFLTKKYAMQKRKATKDVLRDNDNNNDDDEVDTLSMHPSSSTSAVKNNLRVHDECVLSVIAPRVRTLPLVTTSLHSLHVHDQGLALPAASPSPDSETPASYCVDVDIQDLPSVLTNPLPAGTLPPGTPAGMSTAIEDVDPCALRYYIDYYAVKGGRHLDLLRVALSSSTHIFGTSADLRQSLPATTSLAEVLYVQTSGVFSRLITQTILQNPTYTATRVAIPCSVYASSLIAPMVSPPLRFMLNWSYSMALSLFHVELGVLQHHKQQQQQQQEKKGNATTGASTGHKYGKHNRGKKSQSSVGTVSLHRDVDMKQSNVLSLEEQVAYVRGLDLLTILSLDVVSIVKGRVMMTNPYIGYPTAELAYHHAVLEHHQREAPLLQTQGNIALRTPEPKTVVFHNNSDMIVPTTLPSLAYLVRAVLMYPEAVCGVIQGQSFVGSNWSSKLDILRDYYKKNSYITRVTDIFVRRSASGFRQSIVQPWVAAAVDLALEFLTVNPHTNGLLKDTIQESRSIVYNERYYTAVHPLRQLEEEQYCDDVVQPPQEELFPQGFHEPDILDQIQQQQQYHQQQEQQQRQQRQQRQQQSQRQQQQQQEQQQEEAGQTPAQQAALPQRTSRREQAQRPQPQSQRRQPVVAQNDDLEDIAAVLQRALNQRNTRGGVSRAFEEILSIMRAEMDHDGGDSLLDDIMTNFSMVGGVHDGDDDSFGDGDDYEVSSDGLYSVPSEEDNAIFHSFSDHEGDDGVDDGDDHDHDETVA